ncbi:hypothetical protein CAEBREN_03158 [Caenorhabditis brenneri]|uniref:Uncharacterized protein n=1 Tax=Caenorhabditis brenneri TaxID=135651 RepID=G0MDJ4_CAEBE|nr:hypothetical protein CAEBREN_03158 [Caenorhabditis brenneri]
MKIQFLKMVSTTAPAKRDCSVFPWIVLVSLQIPVLFHFPYFQGVFSIVTIFHMCIVGRSFYLKRKKIAKKEKSEKKETTTTTDVGATGNQP